jgi:hypothetical protein
LTAPLRPLKRKSRYGCIRVGFFTDLAMRMPTAQRCFFINGDNAFDPTANDKMP